MNGTLHPTPDDVLTTPRIARVCGLEEWQLRSLLRRGLIPRPQKCGPMHLWRASDMAAIRLAAERVGYIQPAESPTEEARDEVGA